MSKYIRHINLFIIALAALSLTTACSEDELFSDIRRKETVVTFRPTVANSLPTRAVSDGKSVDKLIVKVYEKGTFLLSKEMTLADAQKGIPFTLIEEREYQVLFFAYSSQNTAYTLTDEGKLRVDYSDYLDKGFTGMEELDVFYTVDTLTAGAAAEKTVSLTRPMAQLNFLDADNQPNKGTHQAVVTLNKIPTQVNLLTGDILSESENVEFTFTDFKDEKLTIDGKEAWYVSTNYLFVPVSNKISATIDLQSTDGKSLIKHENIEVTLEKNKRTNVLGEIVTNPVAISVWNGEETEPKTGTTDDGKTCYIIEDASNVAWLSNNTQQGRGKSLIMNVDVDMSYGEFASINLPEGATVQGNGHTVKNLRITDGSLFGDAAELMVSDLNIEDITVSSTVTHIGALVNTLKGSSSFTNVTVKNAKVTTDNGAAGGIVGYIDTQSDVSFDNCHVSTTTINGSTAEGHFVGLMRGYDNADILTFNANCSTENNTITDYQSIYVEGHEGEWLKENDYSKYNGWLGCEEYYRGMVYYGENRFIPKWDGKSKVTPLIENGNKSIYSAFDLASQQNTSAGNLKFMEHVDMGSKNFEPLSYISSLYGNYKTIYNLKIDTQWDANAWSGGAFARRCAGGIFENITFKDANVRVTHSSSDGDAYAAIVCATLEGDPVTMNNVNVIGGSLYGVNKMGGIAGYIVSNLNCTNCSVDGLSIENYDSGGKDSFGFKANGEVGGMFGFIAANANISGCYVKNTILDCNWS